MGEVSGNGQTYVLEDQIGAGSHGDIYRARRKSDGLEFALKFVERGATVEGRALREMTIGCPSYAPCLEDEFDSDRGHVLVQQLMDGDLFDYDVEERDVGNMVLDLVFALHCMHDRGLAHLDIKMENVFWYQAANRPRFKIGDFDYVCSSEKSWPSCGIRGTLYHPDLLYNPRFPRIAIDLELAQKLDVWALMVSIYAKLSLLGFLDEDDGISLIESVRWDAKNEGYTRQTPKPVPVEIPTDADFGLLKVSTIEELLNETLNAKSLDQMPTTRDLLDIIAESEDWTSKRLLDSYRPKEGCGKSVSLRTSQSNVQKRSGTD